MSLSPPQELGLDASVVLLAGERSDGRVVRRRLLGVEVAGESFSTPLAAPSDGELFALRHRGGDSVVLGFTMRHDCHPAHSPLHELVHRQSLERGGTIAEPFRRPGGRASVAACGCPPSPCLS